MNRQNLINEVVTQLENVIGGNVYPDTYKDTKEIPCVIVAGTEEIDLTMPNHSEIDLEIIIAVNDLDGGGASVEDVYGVICGETFKSDIEAGGLVKVHGIFPDGTEINRGDSVTQTSINYSAFCFKL